MKKLKVYVVGDFGQNYPRWISNYTLVFNLQDADVVFFTGGEDVSPVIYNCQKLPATYNNFARDAYEKQIFESINPKKQIAMGVCRGSQILCALNGGVLVQDCDNHAIGGTHKITTIEGEEYDITSTHHQMQDPYGLPENQYEVFAWANRSTHYEGYKLHPDKLAEKEPEIVIYNVPNNPVCLAIQGHPEMMNNEAPIIEKLNQLLYNLIK